MNASITSIDLKPQHAWRCFWLLLGEFLVALFLASIVPTPGAWSDTRSQWVAPAAAAIVALLFLFAAQWTYWHGRAINRLQVWILSLVFGAVLVAVAIELRDCILFLQSAPNNSLQATPTSTSVPRCAVTRTACAALAPAPLRNGVATACLSSGR